MFNTLKYSRILEATGVSREQAEAHIQIMAEIVEGELATKQDIKDLQKELKISVTDLEHKMEQLEYHLVVKLTAILVPVISLTIAVMTFIMRKV